MPSIRSRRISRLKAYARVKAMRRDRQIRHERKKRRVMFSTTISVVLIPKLCAYDEETKSKMWWKRDDYMEFIRDFYKNG